MFFFEKSMACDCIIHIFLFSVTALLRKLKQQSRESVEEKRPRLLNALKEVNHRSVCQKRKGVQLVLKNREGYVGSGKRVVPKCL